MPVPTSALNPRSNASEFFGPLGATVLVPVLPVVIYGLYFSCNEASGGCPPDPWTIPFYINQALSNKAWWASLFDLEAFGVFIAWMAWMVLLWAVLPGEWVEGTTLRNGTKQKYKINAFSTLLATLGVVTGWIIRYGPQGFTWAYEHYLGLITASVIYSTLQTTILYALSFQGEKLLALGGNSEWHIYNFWMGRELNPMIGSLDIKSFCELRPGLIGWVVLNISMACEQATRNGGRVTDSMILVVLFQGWYVFESLYLETAIFTQMDITTDGFGFMLNFGDLAWVPFVYTLQARYLAFRPVELGRVLTFVIFSANALGYWIFRSANNEKDDFRKGLNPKGLLALDTERGTKLLISGWWGWLQHPNYFGDLIMTASWCAATGIDGPVTYFHIVYFTILLIHRQLRDDEACRKKYGKDWDVYTHLVPYKIIPYIY
ncbi:ERG4/ERG24 ergosterol biosynthesis protein [Clavulina sp. PMI_390]|nr:ERG4/ERG24 ergosterol biosynthesis protein [Clavulina sp. PMI_390]